MDLEILAGGYQGEYELGGLSLQNLRVSEGGSQTTCHSPLQQCQYGDLQV